MSGDNVAIDTPTQQQSYALGYTLSEKMLSQMTGVEADAFLAGIRAYMNSDTVQPVAAYQAEQTTKREAAAQETAAENRSLPGQKCQLFSTANGFVSAVKNGRPDPFAAVASPLVGGGQPGLVDKFRL
ncbi:MAG: FKBP-type peptidyl-prolyl cis-trans isomerase N-terminal domain-containing protein [Alcanivorax sp.]|nr:FKBP-type peptidyl-prolyl cis-trans isomerase N-terminal domain-containing protein [Alcanivorax sp.]